MVLGKGRDTSMLFYMDCINLGPVVPWHVKMLFVCVGNTCRSQMAEAIARNLGYEAASAGTSPGHEVNKDARIVLKEAGIDFSGLYPKPLDGIETSSYDKIISMGCGVECPDIPIDQDWGLEDPLGKSLEFYRHTMQTISKLIGELVVDRTDA